MGQIVERRTSLRREVDAVLNSPTFERSPVLSRLLGYLLSREIAADGKPSQFDIAIEALGKTDNFNEQTDSAVRVQMSRLRKALRDYYLTHEPEDGLYIYVKRGDYRLRAAGLGTAYPKLAVSRSLTGRKVHKNPLHIADIDSSGEGANGRRTLLASLLVRVSGAALGRAKRLRVPWKWGAAAIALGGLAAYIPIDSAPEISAAPDQVHHLEVPTVALAIETISFGEQGGRSQALLAKIENDLSELLRKSMISRLAIGPDVQDADFRLSVEIEAYNDEYWDAQIVLSDAHNKVIAERKVPRASDPFELSESLADQAISLVSPAGYITRSLAERVTADPQNDFECFLYIEGARASGKNVEGVLNDCVRYFRDGEFTPYLQIRQAFFDAQKISLAGGQFDDEGAVWKATSYVLASHPENPYANTLAAKMLAGRGDCRNAIKFGQEGFLRGRTYPALELAVIVDTFDCPAPAEVRSSWRDRIATITRANPDPHTLLQSYILLGLLLSEQEPLIELQKAPVFELAVDESLATFNNSLRAAVVGEASSEDLAVIRSTLPALVFSPTAQQAVLKRLDEINH